MYIGYLAFNCQRTKPKAQPAFGKILYPTSIAPDKTGQKLTTIGTSVQWDHFDKNDWQFFTRSVVEAQLRPPGLDRI